MVVKKKITYKKQKGGLEIPKIPDKLTEYFNFIIYKINNYFTNIKEYNPITQYNYIALMINQINLTCSDEGDKDNIYILNLSIKLFQILLKYFGGISYITTLETFVKEILYDICNIPIDNFVNTLINIFIKMLFNEYLLTQPDIVTRNIRLLLSKFHLEFRDNDFLMNRINNIFLTQYRIAYNGVPVFYGNIYDSDPNHLKYNRFICEKVGITSKEKRNYIINPVGALIQPYLVKPISNVRQPQISRLTELFKKILRYTFIPGNKIITEFAGIPRLRHLNNTSKFCIALDRDGKEDIVQSSTLRECSVSYGCTLRMTPIIRDENIASDEHILELLLILLEIELDNPVRSDICNRIKAYVIPQRNQIQPSNNRRRNGPALRLNQEFRPEIELIRRQTNQRRNGSALRPNQEFRPEIGLITRQNNQRRNGSALTPNSSNLSKVKVCREKSECNQGNFCLYNKITAKELLETKYYMMVLKKLYKEAYKLIRKTTPYNSSDIQNRTKLLEIIRLLKINPQTRLNIHHNLVRNLKIIRLVK